MFSKIVELLLRDKPLIAKLRKNIVNNGRYGQENEVYNGRKVE